jgi:hypothetical protein
MKRFALSVALCLAVHAPATLAQPGPGNRDFRGPPPGRDMSGRDMQRRDFDRARPDQERDRYDRQREMERRQTMSPDERRQLRRDIGDHGREVYRDRGRQ